MHTDWYNLGQKIMKITKHFVIGFLMMSEMKSIPGITIRPRTYVGHVIGFREETILLLLCKMYIILNRFLMDNCYTHRLIEATVCVR